MRNIINIKGFNQKFGYMMEYNRQNNEVDVETTGTIKYFVDGSDIHLHTSDENWFRSNNEWVYGHDEDCLTSYIPTTTDISMVRLYFPNHSADRYKDGVKYMVSFNTWIGGHRIGLGSFLVNRVDAHACEDGVFEHGLDRYYDCIEFNIIDPNDLIYSSKWKQFRDKVCGVTMNTNNVGSLLNVSIHMVTDNELGYMMLDDDFVGGTSSFNIVRNTEGYLSLHIEPDLDNLGWKMTTVVPNKFCTDTNPTKRLYDYIKLTYGIPVSVGSNVKYELVAKNHNTLVQGPAVEFRPNTLGDISDHITQTLEWGDVLGEPDFHIVVEDGEERKIPNPRCGLRHYFESWTPLVDGWPHFEEGWFLQCSMTVTLGEKEMYIVSNEYPITQETFKFFVGWDESSLRNRNKIEDMEIRNYTLVNKVENKIIQLERPDKSKSNIIQPVFFRVKDTELLTLHPAVTENICINLDDYKSKVDVFYLQIGNTRYNQLGANQFGIIFKVVGSSLPQDTDEGTYYILNEDYELVTKGKYKYAK
jgi:hypothetical protein